MKGETVGQFTITELLGSGRGGMLYLAVDSVTGQRVVVQRMHSEVMTRDFASEAKGALKLAFLPQVQEEQTGGGHAVLVAYLDDREPGSGFTRYTHTQRLPPPPPPAKRRSWVLVLTVLVFLSLGLVGALLVQTLSGDAVEPAAVAPLPPTPAAPSAPVVLTPPPKQDEPTAVLASPAQPSAPSLPPVSVAPRRPSSPTCVPDDEWKAGRRADIEELLTRASATEALHTRFLPTLTQLAYRVRDARDSAECSRIGRAISALNAEIPVP